MAEFMRRKWDEKSSLLRVPWRDPWSPWWAAVIYAHYLDWEIWRWRGWVREPSGGDGEWRRNDGWDGVKRGKKGLSADGSLPLFPLGSRSSARATCDDVSAACGHAGELCKQISGEMCQPEGAAEVHVCVCVCVDHRCGTVWETVWWSRLFINDEQAVHFVADKFVAVGTRGMSGPQVFMRS